MNVKVKSRMLRKAIKFAKNKHKGQVDKSGKAYINHPLTVMNRCDGNCTKIVAVLHDVLEDTDTIYEELKEEFTPKIAKSVLILTRIKVSGTEGQSYMGYIKDVAKNNIAKQVKIQDLIHNMDLARLDNVHLVDVERNKKYLKALEYLLNN